MPRKRNTYPKDYNEALPSNLRSFMKQKKLTQQTLANYLNVTRQSVSYYCDGSSAPDWKIVVKLADYFGVSCDYLLGRTNDIHKHKKPAVVLRMKMCKHCGKHFVPAKRSDTLYCDNPSPENPNMTCKQYAASRLWYERQKEDELANLSRKIASAKGMLAKRNPDIPQYAESYEYFKAHRLTWIKAVKDGTKSKDEYREWLIYMQSQKRIKEAAHVTENH